ncbi:uncharacterized protein F4822DRAFT_416249 [Hypoxylon trugodes]|uniref:uncharacterized protein n=1 Tax=Hypoxylon trugodes TaxID=326681 RepID=UPI00219BA452|nr:uncharacterized protein F4822DRAFT_416249 [Hypoxylon trugodes]KAI1384784.1 hypothetical protein F4822DRAFT_416249 [Hypoxylon trugodes]
MAAVADRPLSATTSRISMTGRRDFGVKFMAGVEEFPKSPPNENSNEPAPLAPAVAPAPTALETAKPYEPPPYWERVLEAGGARDNDDYEEYEGCHPFWMGWYDILRGMGLILAAAFKIPLVFGHGVAKTFHYIPSLYHDDTVRKWPKITGFPSACAASFQVLWWGILDGLTDWVVLPYKGAKKEGVKGFFKGMAKGFGSVIFKLGAGAVGFATHPFFGIYKEAAKFKVDIKRERRPRQDVASLI